MHDLISRATPTPHAYVDISHAPDCKGREFDRIHRRVDTPCEGWCYIHNQCEPLRSTDYRVCGECFHVFRSEAELIRSHLLVMQMLSNDYPEHMLDDQRRLPKVLTYRSDVTGDQIHCCPHCAHDF